MFVFLLVKQTATVVLKNENNGIFHEKGVEVAKRNNLLLNNR